VTQLYGFGPVADQRSRILILGSMPGVASLAKAQYYGHPRNAFWPIMGELFGATPQLEYPSRLQRLLSNHVALWDVLMSCQRPGSLDADIEAGTERANDFSSLLGPGSTIRAIFFNGVTAQRLFNRHVANAIDAPERFERLRLPSTSPAHAAMSLAEKLQAWKQIRDYLR
jgi:hypoxanthine-DNA glycosylase